MNQSGDHISIKTLVKFLFNKFRMDISQVIVSARKPEFFQMSHPLYEVVTDDGLMRPCFKACSGGTFWLLRNCILVSKF